MIPYQKESRRQLARSERTCIIIGSEPCDLDSAVCAIALAVYYTKSSYFAGTQRTRFIPVLNMRRKHFHLKTDIFYFLKKYRIGADCLIFIDDLSDAFIKNNAVILVDHHVSRYRDTVIAVFDHRPFDSSSNLPIFCKKIIEPVGSCATLIGDLILRTGSGFEKYRVILKLLYGAIILDTENFSTTAGLATDYDLRVVSEIEALTGITDPIPYRAQLHTYLLDARAYVGSLTAIQLLYKDLRVVSNPDESINVGIPEYPISVQQFIRKPDAEKAIRQFSEELNCSVVLLMGVRLSERTTIARDIGLINISNKDLFNEVLTNLNTANADLKLVEHYGCDFLGGQYFYQANISATRQQVLSIIEDILKQKTVLTIYQKRRTD